MAEYVDRIRVEKEHKGKRSEISREHSVSGGEAYRLRRFLINAVSRRILHQSLANSLTSPDLCILVSRKVQFRAFLECPTKRIVKEQSFFVLDSCSSPIDPGSIFSHQAVL